MDIVEARSLAEQHLSNALPQRWQHVQSVAARAAELTALCGLNDQTAVVAAWLHDIGYSPALNRTDFHPLDGARFLRAEGWPDETSVLVANHTNAIRQASEVGLADQLRAEFPDEDSIARDILWTADAHTGPSGEPLTIDERIEEVRRRYGDDHPVTRCMNDSRSALQAAEARVAELIAAQRRQPI